MEAMRDSWTDERLDDFRAETARRFDELDRRVDNGFNRVDADVRRLRDDAEGEFAVIRREMKDGFEAVDKRFEKVDERFEKLDGRFEKLDGHFEKIDERFVLLSDRLMTLHALVSRTCVYGLGILSVLVTVIGIKI
jgi:hypothetical protein